MAKLYKGLFFNKFFIRKDEKKRELKELSESLMNLKDEFGIEKLYTASR